MLLGHRTVDLLKFIGGNWILRATILAGAILLLGLIWPADHGQSAQGTHRWASSAVNFHTAGNWPGAEQAHIVAIQSADDVWRDNTNWDPSIVPTEQANDIYWGESPVANVGAAWTTCLVPVGRTGAWAIECTKTSRRSLIVESDIAFNRFKDWGSDGSRVLGVAVHELGHSAGLIHDPPYRDAAGNILNVHCNPRSPDRWTMCSGSNASNVADKATLEQHDIDDANALYP